MSESKQKTAPRLFGTLEVVCEGVDEWCGQALPAEIEMNTKNMGASAEVECQRCGRWYVVSVFLPLREN